MADRVKFIHVKSLHTFFDLDVTLHEDIISFIDIVFDQLRSNNFDFNVQTTPPGKVMPKNITLHDKEYRVMVANTPKDRQCKITIEPTVADPAAAAGYPPTGYRANKKTDVAYGYKMMMSSEYFDADNLPTHIQTFFPCFK